MLSRMKKFILLKPIRVHQEQFRLLPKQYQVPYINITTKVMLCKKLKDFNIKPAQFGYAIK